MGILYMSTENLNVSALLENQPLPTDYIFLETNNATMPIKSFWDTNKEIFIFFPLI